MNSFQDQVVFVTGAGRGIGRQLALDLAAEGAAVAALDIDPEPLAEVRAALASKRIATAVADVTDGDSVRKAVAEFQEQLGPIDLLIANAGIGRETSALDFHAKDVEAQIRVNLLGVAHCIEAVLPGMIARRRGHIAGISSMASYHGLPRMAGYCASKAGLNALLDGLRVELKPLGIHVTTLCPGWVRTRLTDGVDLPLVDMLEVSDAARLILAAIRAKRPFAVFPPRTAWRVRLLSWLPAAAGDWLVRKMLDARTSSRDASAKRSHSNASPKRR